MWCSPDRFCSIPEPAWQGLVATECVCRTVLVNKEAPMDIKMNHAVRSVRNWLQKYHVALVCVLSVIHIGLSHIHTRASGRVDLECCLR